MILKKNKGLSQKKLSKQVNGRLVNISRYETDSIHPNAQTLVKLSDFFNVSVDYLLWDNQETQQRINFKDEEFLNLLQDIDHLPEKERNSLKNLIKSYLNEHGRQV